MLLVFALLAAMILLPRSAFAATAGPRYGTLEENDDQFTPGGATWVPLGNAGAVDGVWNEAAFSGSPGYSDYLKVTGFGFSIPAEATIDGIIVTVTAKAEGYVFDDSILIVKGGSFDGLDQSLGNGWATIPHERVFGGASQRWGLSWTPADINATDFGVGISTAGDAMLNSKAFVDAVTITVHYTCPPSGPCGTPAASVGGDGGEPLWLRLLRRRMKELADARLPGELRLRAFLDLDRSGRQEQRERTGFNGLAVSIRGADIDGNPLEALVRLGTGGTATVRLPPSTASGYAVLLPAIPSSYDLTSVPGTVVVRASSSTGASIGLAPKGVQHYAPCLRVAADSGGETGTASDAELLLRRLVGPDGVAVGTELLETPGLVSRREFLRLLWRAFCIDDVVASARENTDVPPDVAEEDAPWFREFIGLGMPVLRSTPAGAYADLGSPIRRDEANAIIASAKWLVIGATDQSGAVLDIHMPPGTASSGLLRREAAMLIANGAIQAGRISFEDMDQHDSGSEARSLSLPSPLTAVFNDACLEWDASRPDTFDFADVVPGEPEFASVRRLLSVGIRNSEGRMLWLLPGTARTPEFGVEDGRGRLSMDAPASMVEVIRALLILNCLPPPTPAEVRSNPGDIAGTALTRVPSDHVSGLERGTTFTSRLLYRAQDHLTEFDLSLFRFAPHLLTGDPRSPSASYTVEEASWLIASAILMRSVRDRTVTPMEAETLAAEATDRVREWILNGRGDPGVTFRRRDLLRFLVVAIPNRVAPELRSVGESWLLRMR